MNAVIALCHFCEHHGPSLVFCTQAFHADHPQHMMEEESTASSEPGSFNNFRDRYLKSPTEGSVSSLSSLDHVPPTKSSEMCDACRPVTFGHSGFISNDSDAKVSYVSMHYPDHRQVYSMVRQACVRSLSCEVCPGREGPIFFGDDHRGHVLSYTFYVQDSHARGLQRWFSIIVVMMDKIYLLNSWPFLVQHIRDIIEKVQTQASAVYEEEQVKCPQRAHRLTKSMNPTNFRLHRGGNKPARSLVELTNDKNLFQILHSRFTWILKACGNRLTERLLEGPPTEDSIIDLENQEETEEGFIKVFTRKLNVSAAKKTDSEESLSSSHDSGADSLEDTTQTAIKNLRHLLMVLGDRDFLCLAHHVVIGNQIIIRGGQTSAVKLVIAALKSLLPKGCCRVVPYSHEYEDSWRCNFLGLSLQCELPEHVLMSDLCVLLEILDPPGNKDGDCPSLSNFTFEISTVATMPEKVPAVLKKMTSAISNSGLSHAVVERCLICLKEEWMNKVKVMFKFTKAAGNRSEEETKRLLATLGAQEEDRQLLKFWITGLSVQFKTHMLSSGIPHMAVS